MNALVERPRLPQWHVNQVVSHLYRIRPFARVKSPALLLQCSQAGLPADVAEVCAGLLASVTEDLMFISTASRTSLERSKRMERVLAACDEPAASALRVAIACSPLNGKACVRHWDVICDKHEVGRMAWLLGMQTDSAYHYGRKFEKQRKGS